MIQYPHLKVCAISTREDDEEKDQSLKLALWQSWVWSISDFIFLASAYHSRVGYDMLSTLTIHCQWEGEDW